MPNDLTPGIVITLSGGFLFVKGIQSLQKKRVIQNIPTSKVRSLAMGLVEVFGIVCKDNKPIFHAPFSDKECVYYKYKVEQLRQHGKNSSWDTIKQDETSDSFFIQDDTGKVLVNPKGAEMTIPITFNYEARNGMGFSSTKFPTPTLDAFCKANKILQTNTFNVPIVGSVNVQGGGSYRFTEECIPLEHELYVLGTAGDNPHVEDLKAQDNSSNIMIQKGKNDPMFYISDKSEKDTLSSLGGAAILGIGGGLLAIAVGLYLLFLNMGIL